MLSRPEPFFLDGRAGRLFCILFPGGGPGDARRGVLVVPPFAEEMNKCRRMMALAARALQARGADVLMLDPTGTGDSEGDFADARIDIWTDDLRRGAACLRDRGNRSLDVLAVRGGALLVGPGLLPGQMAAGRLALWQAVASGRQVAAQFLRLRVAEAVTGGSKGAPAVNQREALRAQGTIEVAGYTVSEDLIVALEGLDLSGIAGGGWTAVHWFEIAAPGVATLPPASVRAIEGLRGSDVSVDAEIIAGDPFWATPEIAVVDELVARTAAALGTDLA